jgi:hypothetical protein
MENEIISIPIGYKNNLEISHKEIFGYGSSIILILILFIIFLKSYKI